MHPYRQRVIDERFEFHFNGTVCNVANVRDTHFHMGFEACNGIGLALFEEVPGGKNGAREQENDDNQFKWLLILHGVRLVDIHSNSKSIPTAFAPAPHVYG